MRRSGIQVAPMPLPVAPETYTFADDGSIPNNPRLPFLVYRAAIDLKGTPNPEEIVENTFASNRWGEMWRNGVYPYAHYHSMIHEAMGLARGRAKVRFGGRDGVEIDIFAGDVCILPAGTGHQGLWASPDLMVIGAYPPNGKYDLCRGSKAEHTKAIAAIPDVPIPTTDPAFGPTGPLIQLGRI
jgi:uncharacterized protein YjlB